MKKNKEIGDYTFNTDVFTEDLKKRLKQLIKNEDNGVMVRGIAKEEFEKWLEEEYNFIPPNKNVKHYYPRKEEQSND